MTDQVKLTHVFAIADNAWGRGEDPQEALNNWKKNVGSIRRDIKVNMRYCDEKAYVDEMGGLSYNRCEKLPDVVITEKLADQIWHGQCVLTELCEPVTDKIYDLEG